MNEFRNRIEETAKPLIIAGPCSAETEKQMMETAEGLNPDEVSVFRAGIWKPRTKPDSFEGVGEKGLKWLRRVKEEYGFQTATEVANAQHVALALENEVDVLWIGARTTVNPFTVQEIAEALQGSQKTVLVKNPVNPDLELWIGGIERLKSQGIKNIGAVHRGFSTYKKTKYRNNPQWQIALDFINRLPDIPMICDPSHICGNREGLAEVAQMAYNFDYKGLMLETHCNPDDAWSDANQQITPERLHELLSGLRVRQKDDKDAVYHSNLLRMRNEMDEADRTIFETVAQRMLISSRIGELKKDHNVALFQLERWQQVRESALVLGKELGLSSEFVDKFLKAIHEESLQQQHSVMKKENRIPT